MALTAWQKLTWLGCRHRAIKGNPDLNDGQMKHTSQSMINNIKVIANENFKQVSNALARGPR